MIYCSHCGTQNRDGSKFCSNCAARLTPPSGLVCPMCSTSNPFENVFCSKCGARLVPLTGGPESDQRESAPPIKGLSLPTKPATPDDEAETEDVPITKEKIDDWLTKLRESPPVEDEGMPPLPAKPLPAPPPATELPNWVQELHTQAEQPTITAGDSDKSAVAPDTEMPGKTEQELPIWLKELDATAQLPRLVTPTEEEPSSTPASALDELPAWLQAATPEKTESEVLPFAPNQEEREQEPSFEPPVTESEPEPAPVEPARAEEIPAWVAELKPSEEQPPALPPAPTAEIQPGPIQPARREELPSWIAELKPALDQSAATAQEPEAEVQTEELDEWLRLPKLEPGASIAADELASEPVEIRGPLANLRGVLPLAKAMTEAHPIPKPASEQKDGTHLFEEILAEPQGQAPRVMRRRARRGLLTARPLIYSLLIFAVILALFTPPAISGFLLEISSTPAADFYDVIQSLPSNSPVLVSFDYDPSLSGEMDLVSLAILRHLIQRRINIVALSTLEQGPMIAQRVLAVATADANDYRYGDNYLNLGFLPGHESGIAQLAAQGIPSGGRDFNQNQLISQYPLAANLKNVRGLPIVIELAGGEEPLRMWVEQFQPNTRIAAGVSASVEPKAVAYRDANQLAALVSGPTGAAQYEILSNQQGEAVRRATAQSLAQITIVFVILAGNVVFWISRLMERK